MINRAFDEYSSKYDEWFLKNLNVLASEAALLAYFLAEPGKAFSVGCGTGLFEAILIQEYGIVIEEGLEPSEAMAEVARKRGKKVAIGTAEEYEYGSELYDTIIFNGSPSYISDLKLAFQKSYTALKKGGKIVVLDVPKESSYALLYNLAKETGSWEHPSLEGIKPPNPYPIEFVSGANWRSTPEKVEILKVVGFTDFQFAQTLTKHPLYSDKEIEQPSPGYDKGDYVAICAVK